MFSSGDCQHRLSRCLGHSRLCHCFQHSSGLNLSRSCLAPPGFGVVSIPLYTQFLLCLAFDGLERSPFHRFRRLSNPTRLHDFSKDPNGFGQTIPSHKTWENLHVETKNSLNENGLRAWTLRRCCLRARVELLGLRHFLG